LIAKKPKIKLATKEILGGMEKSHMEITPPIKKFIKCTTDTAIKIKAATLVT
tara:strand:- start:113 stop:268 length:156 start_codon:yes stop_codon:yes gene_type:complete